MTRTRSRESGLNGPGRQVAAGPRNYRHCGGMQNHQTEAPALAPG